MAVRHAEEGQRVGYPDRTASPSGRWAAGCPYAVRAAACRASPGRSCRPAGVAAGGRGRDDVEQAGVRHVSFRGVDGGDAVEPEAVPGWVDRLDPGLVEGAHDPGQLRGGVGGQHIMVEAAVNIEVVALIVVDGTPEGEPGAERVSFTGLRQG